MQAALKQLKEHAKHLIKTEPESDHLSLMRNKAGELSIDLDVKDADLLLYLDDAERSLNPSKVYRRGEQLEASEPTFLLDGLIQLGETNLIVGQPKVGKSSFMVGFAAALRDQRQMFLGREVALPSQRMPVLLFGTDQSVGNWLHFLRREGIADESQAIDLDFFCDIDASNDYNFTKEGLKAMRAEIDQHQFPLVIIDSLNSMMEPTGMEENNSRYAQPIRNAIRELRKTGATLVIIHHARKTPTTWDWITECRGSSSIAGTISWGFLMRWVSQEEEGLMRVDRRVGFAGKGRGSGESGGVMGEYLSEGGWTYLDGLEAAQQVERMGQKIMGLGGVRQQVFDYLTMRSELGAAVTSDELATELNKTRSAMNRELRILKGTGLVRVTGAVETGSRPTQLWLISPAAQMFLSGSSRGTEGGFSAFSASFANKSVKDKEINSRNEEQPWEKNMPIGSPVELLRGSEWQNGWLVHEHTSAGLITAVKTGDPQTRINNLRPDLDVRPCETPFKAAAEPEPDVRSEEPHVSDLW